MTTDGSFTHLGGTDLVLLFEDGSLCGQDHGARLGGQVVLADDLTTQQAAVPVTSATLVHNRPHHSVDLH